MEEENQSGKGPSYVMSKKWEGLREGKGCSWRDPVWGLHEHSAPTTPPYVSLQKPVTSSLCLHCMLPYLPFNFPKDI